MRKNIFSRVMKVSLALVVSFFCISAFLVLFYIIDSIINIYTQGPSAYNTGKLTGELTLLILSILILFLLKKQKQSTYL